jgi:hypothetical protein
MDWSDYNPWTLFGVTGWITHGENYFRGNYTKEEKITKGWKDLAARIQDQDRQRLDTAERLEIARNQMHRLGDATCGAIQDVCLATAGMYGASGPLRGPRPSPRTSFNTLIDEGGAKLVEVTLPSGKKVEVMFNESWDGTTLILKRTHIEGLKPGDVGPTALFDAAKAYGCERGAKKIVIEGHERATGRNKGKTPKQWEFNLE